MLRLLDIIPHTPKNTLTLGNIIILVDAQTIALEELVEAIVASGFGGLIG